MILRIILYLATEHLKMTDTAKAKIVEWALQQGVSTTLLVGILVFMAYDVVHLKPINTAEIKAGYKEIAADHRETVREVIAANERNIDTILKVLDIKRAPGQAP